MAQHARPVGPSTTNAAATVSVEMMQGARPDRSPGREDWRQIQRRAGWHTAQTTHVAATFTPDMVIGSKPERNRQLLPPRSDYDFIPPEVPAFSVEMILGSRPERARLFLAPRIPLPVSQTTHVQAPFSTEMAVGSKPDLPRLPFVAKVGWSVSQLTHVAAAFTVDMIAGAHPDSPRLPFTAKSGWVGIAPDVPVFSIDMVQGWHPDSPRIMLGPRILVPWTQTTHVEAPFTIDMVRGVTPTPRPIQQGRTGCLIVAPDVQLFSIEMFQGWRPDRPVLMLAPRIPLPWSQTTQTDAPFSVDMIAGDKPAQKPKQDLRLKVGWLAQTTDVFAFSVEMTQGSRPDSPRLFLAPKIPLPWSQTTHVSAAFSLEMSQGAVSGRNRERLLPSALKAGQQLWTPEVVQAIVEMVQGSRPDRPRLFLAPRIPLPWAQSTPIAAPVSIEMLQGVRWIPSHYKALNAGLCVYLYQGASDVIFIYAKQQLVGTWIISQELIGTKVTSVELTGTQGRAVAAGPWAFFVNYVVGDVVNYLGRLYSCIADNSGLDPSGIHGPEAWSPVLDMPALDLVGTFLGIYFYVGPDTPALWDGLIDYPTGSIVLGEGSYFYALRRTLGEPPPTGGVWLNIDQNTAVILDTGDVIGTKVASQEITGTVDS